MTRRTRRNALAALALSIAAASRAFGAATPPALPARNVDETMPTPMGATRVVHSGDDLQSVLNAAQAGDVIQLDAGATFTGNFVLPVKAGTDQTRQIVVRSSAYASLPAGKRVGPGDAGEMAKIVARGLQPAITFSDGASYYRLVGLEIATTWSETSKTYWQLVCMGRRDDCSADAKTEASLPHHVIFDRVYVHGTPTGNVRRGILANAAWVGLVDSYISDIHEVGADTQAFGAWNGTGPYLIRNSYLEAGAENIMFGGADASIPNLVSSDVTVTHNTFYKPDSWNQNHPSYGKIQWTIKNLFELKNAQRVLLSGNVFDNCWGYQGDQPGYAIQLTPRNQSGANPWSVVQDVTIKNNVFRNVGGGINLLATDYGFPSQFQSRVQIWNNLIYNVRGQFMPGTGAAFQALSGPNDVSVRHNTTDTPVAILYMDGTNKTGLRLEWVDNLHNHGSYGFFGTNYGVGNRAIAQYLPNEPTITNNVMAAGDPSWYSNYPGNFFPANLAAVGFQDYDKRDLRLLPSSSFHNAATDGKDIGVDFAEFDTAQAGTALPPR